MRRQFYLRIKIYIYILEYRQFYRGTINFAAHKTVWFLFLLFFAVAKVVADLKVQKLRVASESVSCQLFYCCKSLSLQRREGVLSLKVDFAAAKVLPIYTVAEVKLLLL